MKLFALILAICISYLAAMPCADAILAAESCDTEAAHHHPPGENPDDHGDSDFCSPFCICSCCQTHIVTLGMEPVEAITLIPIHIKNSNEPHMIGLEAVFECWHPPNV